MAQPNKNVKAKSQSSKQVKNGNGSQAKTTIAELQEQLAEANGKLKDTMEILQEKTEQKQTAQQDLEKFKSENQMLKEENDTLDKKLSALEKNTANEMAKVKRNLRETERQLNNMKAENESLAKKADDFDKIETATATFQIYINYEEGEYRGRIIHNLSKDILKFSELNFDDLNDFIKKYIPAPELHSTDATPETETEWQSVATTEETFVVEETFEKKVPAVSSVLDQVMLKQAGEFFNVENTVRSNQDFSIHLKLNFTDIMASVLQDESQFAFEVDVLAKNTENTIVAKNGFADEVPLTTQGYECSIKMPRLESGNYQFSIYTTIPEIQFLAQDVIEVQVNYN